MLQKYQETNFWATTPAWTLLEGLHWTFSQVIRCRMIGGSESNISNTISVELSTYKDRGWDHSLSVITNQTCLGKQMPVTTSTNALPKEVPVTRLVGAACAAHVKYWKRCWGKRRSRTPGSMSALADSSNPLRKFKLVFLGEQSGEEVVYIKNSPLPSPYIV